MPEAGVGDAARRNLLQGALLLIGGALPAWTQARQERPGASAWSAWDNFARQFMQADGRIVANSECQTHSEAQSYALMFALIANDRARFELVLRWTEDNLCAGDLTARLPAWLWAGKPPANGAWSIPMRHRMRTCGSPTPLRRLAGCGTSAVTARSPQCLPNAS